MSGGVDSSVAAILLKEQGYEVIGYTFRVYDSVSEDCMKKQKGCCTVESIYEARDIAEKMGIEHHIIDLRTYFKETVIDHFIRSYLDGNTPNPCSECNRYIKWGKVFEKAKEMNCEFVATGHYARVMQNETGFFLSQGKDEDKDQTYFLWQIPRSHLSKTLFPLGELTKSEVREIALKHGFEKVAKKADSQEICFIPDNDYRRFLTENTDVLPGPGNFLSVDGRVLGQHKGYPFYTIGQRKGLEIALGERMFVTRINPETNEVTIGQQGDLKSSGMWVRNFNPGKYVQLTSGQKFDVKVRYRSSRIPATIMEVNEEILVHFDLPVDSVTPGQSAVFYQGDDLVGGGVIVKSIE
ncbi:MAG: tRNA 2-thiouridine(34) synthase MnmA [Bacteroidetes bacterium HGW-Bacteroidetes-21]|nr:MAG: tRNA 2-thiouridine(34) synthase MnmA [Bacteroidetes bacterium HGW-Bacteroidetes-21]